MFRDQLILGALTTALIATTLVACGGGGGHGGADERKPVHYVKVALGANEQRKFDDEPHGGVVTEDQVVLMASAPGKARVGVRWGTCGSELGDGTGDNDAYVEGTRLVVLLHSLDRPDAPGVGCGGVVMSTSVDAVVPNHITVTAVALERSKT